MDEIMRHETFIYETLKRKPTVGSGGEIVVPPKRQKVNQEPERSGVFPFLDLPGELQNQIYEYAAEYAHRCFPLVTGAKPKTGLKTASSSPQKTIPFLALTHVCRKIRSDFRPIWLSTNRIPFRALQSYLTIFYPYYSVKKRTTDPESTAFSVSESGILRTWVRPGPIDYRVFMRLLKHKAQHPGYRITCEALIDPNNADVAKASLRWLEQVINNTNPLWIQWVKANRMNLIEVVTGGIHPPLAPMNTPASEKKKLVVRMKVQYGEEWMTAYDTDDYQKHLDSLGLGQANADGGRVFFSVSSEL